MEEVKGKKVRYSSPQRKKATTEETKSKAGNLIGHTFLKNNDGDLAGPKQRSHEELQDASATGKSRERSASGTESSSVQGEQLGTIETSTGSSGGRKAESKPSLMADTVPEFRHGKATSDRAARAKADSDNHSKQASNVERVEESKAEPAGDSVDRTMEDSLVTPDANSEVSLTQTTGDESAPLTEIESDNLSRPATSDEQPLKAKAIPTSPRGEAVEVATGDEAAIADERAKEESTRATLAAAASAADQATDKPRLASDAKPALPDIPDSKPEPQRPQKGSSVPPAASRMKDEPLTPTRSQPVTYRLPTEDESIRSTDSKAADVGVLARQHEPRLGTAETMATSNSGRTSRQGPTRTTHTKPTPFPPSNTMYQLPFGVRNRADLSAAQTANEYLSSEKDANPTFSMAQKTMNEQYWVPELRHSNGVVRRARDKLVGVNEIEPVRSATRRSSTWTPWSQDTIAHTAQVHDTGFSSLSETILGMRAGQAKRSQIPGVSEATPGSTKQDLTKRSSRSSQTRTATVQGRGEEFQNVVKTTATGRVGKSKNNRSPQITDPKTSKRPRERPEDEPWGVTETMPPSDTGQTTKVTSPSASRNSRSSPATRVTQVRSQQSTPTIATVPTRDRVTGNTQGSQPSRQRSRPERTREPAQDVSIEARQTATSRGRRSSASGNGLSTGEPSALRAASVEDNTRSTRSAIGSNSRTGRGAQSPTTGGRTSSRASRTSEPLQRRTSANRQRNSGERSVGRSAPSSTSSLWRSSLQDHRSSSSRASSREGATSRRPSTARGAL